MPSEPTPSPGADARVRYVKQMSIETRVQQALERAWTAHETATTSDTTIESAVSQAVETVLTSSSAPNRQYLLTIAAGTAEHPETNPAALQKEAAGVDRRSQAKKPSKALTTFKNAKGLKLKVSQDPGVSNQFREPEISEEWVSKRKPGKPQRWAGAFLEVVTWLQLTDGEDRRLKAQQLLEYVTVRIVTLAAINQLDYPKFRTTPDLALELINKFLDAAPNRPDALECVTTVITRELMNVLKEDGSVERGDVNSPDPIDILILGEDGTPFSGIEVTDNHITAWKLEHEVQQAMFSLGLSRATVLSRGLKAEDTAEVSAFISTAWSRYEQRIDLVTVEAIGTWLRFPALSRDVSTAFVWGIGEELDEYSTDGNRQAWFKTLSDYAQTAGQD